MSLSSQQFFRQKGGVLDTSWQLVIKPLGTLEFPIGAGVLTFPWHRALNAGKFSGATYDFVHALEVAVGRTGAAKVRENAVAVCVTKGAIVMFTLDST